MSSSTAYEGVNGAIFVATSPRMTPTSNHISVNYHLFRQHVGKESVIRNIDSEIIRQIFSPKICKVNYLSGLGGCYAVGKPSDERKCSKK